MTRVLLSLVAALALFGFAGCGGDGDDGDGGGDTSGLSGTWSGTGSFHTGAGGEPLSMQFTMQLNLSASGNVVSGTFVYTRPVRGTMSGSVSGVVSGGTIQMTLGPYGRLDGNWGAGGAMHLNWFEDWGGGSGLYGTISLAKS